jgi:hypothetical protein
MPLSPRMSAEVPAMSVAVQDLLSGVAANLGQLAPKQKPSEPQPAGSSAPRDTTNCTTKPIDRINSRRF